MRISDWSSDVCSSDLIHRDFSSFGLGIVPEIPKVIRQRLRRLDTFRSVARGGETAVSGPINSDARLTAQEARFSKLTFDLSLTVLQFHRTLISRFHFFRTDRIGHFSIFNRYLMLQYPYGECRFLAGGIGPIRLIWRYQYLYGVWRTGLGRNSCRKERQRACEHGNTNEGKSIHGYL